MINGWLFQYLSLHSPYFLDLFYGPKATGRPGVDHCLNWIYEVEVDPITLGDLLDLIYPCYGITYSKFI